MPPPCWPRWLHAWERRGSELLHAREVHLDAGLAGPGTRAEDIEDDLLPVGNGDAGEFLPVPLLGRRQFIVKNNHVAFARLDQFATISSALPVPMR